MHPARFRRDLIIRRQETPGGPAFVLKDPVTERFFRFSEPEYFIAHELDGATAPDVVRQRVEERFGAALSTETLAQFLERLSRLGLLETDGAEAKPLVNRRKRIRGTLLYLRVPAFDPNRFFDWLVPKVEFFFTPVFMVFSGALIAWAFVFTISSSNEIARDVGRLYRFDALFLAWVAILVITTAHEFAHGLTCKHFRGEVHELGFMLIYFQPAFYCNVSDAWLFPEKSKRLWVTFAGAYFELFLWALATLAWRAVEPGTWMSFLALIVMATSAIKSFFNINPLVKLDGYYFLSDYLEIPNLRQKAFSYLQATVKRLWGSAVRDIQQVTRRERRIYLVYGLLAVVYSYWLLGWIALRLGDYLVGRYQGLGFLLFSGLLMGVFQNPLARAVGKLHALFGSTPENLARMRSRLKLAIPVVILPLLLFGRLELKVAGEFNLLPAQNSDVRAEVEGIIEEVFVNEGESVEKGQLLARLSGGDYEAELAKLDAEINQKRATLKMLRVGPRAEEIELAERQVETARTRHAHAGQQYEQAKQMHATKLARSLVAIKIAEERLRSAGSERDRLQDLFRTGIVSRRQFEESVELAHLRERELEIAQAEWKLLSDDDLADLQKELGITQKEAEEAAGRLTVLQAGSRPEAIEAMEAEIVELETQRRYVAGQLQRVRIVSPAAGVITTSSPQERVGEQLKRGDLLVEVFDLEKVRAEVGISEKEIADVHAGQPVVLKARAYPGKSFMGRVSAIAPRAEPDALERKIVRVTIDMEDPNRLLKPEMTGNAKIFCGKRRIVELLTRRIARYMRVEFWSWW